MNAIRLTYHNSKENVSMFPTCFKNLLFATPSTLWILSIDSFKLPVEWIFDVKEKEFNDAKMYENKSFMLVDTQFLQKYGEYMIDDYNEIVALDVEYHYALEIMQELAQYQNNGITSYMLKRKNQGAGCYKILLHNHFGESWDVLANKDIETYFDDNVTVSVHLLEEKDFIDLYS
ncbi:MAG: hypothetical protein RR929_00375 [Erysipelotrichaceae bacterium]